MKVLELKDIVKKDLAVDYRKVYSAKAVLDIFGSKAEKKIEITLEHTPLGGVDITVTLLDAVEYPLLPVIKAIKESVGRLYEEGGLS